MTDALDVRGIFILIAALATGLSAGLFYTFSIAVMPGLADTDDRTFVRAMREINIRILNGWFGFAFGGAMVFTLVALFLSLGADQRGTLWWLIAAAVLYAAQLAITFGVNVPMNNRLVSDADPARAYDAAAVRAAFERPWVRWNHVRSLLVVAAFVCLLFALIQQGVAAA